MKLIITIFCIFLTLHIFAFKFSPMSQTLVSEKEKNSVFTLENDSNEPIAIQMMVTKRSMDINGKENQEEEKEKLSIYPDQLIVPAGEKRSVKVVWENTDKSKLQTEEAYRVIAEQLPIDIAKNKKKGANIKVLLRYVAAFYVTSEKFDSKVDISKVEVNQNEVKFTVENAGNAHQVLTKLTLNFKTGDKAIEISSDQLKGMAGENILANSKRIFTFPKKDVFNQIESGQKMVMSFEKE